MMKKRYNYLNGWTLFNSLRLIAFVIKSNAKKKLITKRTGFDAVVKVIVIGIILIYSFLFGKGVDIASEQYDLKDIFTSFSLFLGFLIILRNIFPNYKSVFYIKSRLYPIHLVDQYLLSKSNEIFNLYSLLLIVLGFFTLAFSTLFTYVDSIILFSIFYFFYGLNYALRIIIEKKKNPITFIYLFCCLANIFVFYSLKPAIFLLIIGMLIQTLLSFFTFAFRAAETQVTDQHHKGLTENLFKIAGIAFFKNSEIKKISLFSSYLKYSF